jgi:hypothetical protein
MTTKVTELKEQIALIQRDCAPHEFEIGKKAELVESLVPGVYVGRTDGPIKIRTRYWCNQPDFLSTTVFTITCKLCDLSQVHNIPHTCPVCFIRMSQSLRLDNRERYLGMEHLYFAVRLATCPKCGIRVVSDEWDQ